MMREIVCTIIASLIIAAAPGPTASQAFQTESPSEILLTAAGRGREVLAALRDYTYDCELTIQTVSQADTITGTFNRFSKVSFDRDGNRREKVLENTSTLPKEIYIGTQRANELTQIYQFVITPEALNRYEISYIGRERIDELNTFVFDVKPKIKLPDPNKSHERFLKGRIWIDDLDHYVVRVAGEALPEQTGHRSGKFDTFFQNYGRFWFPAFVTGVDFIRVGDYFYRVSVHVRYTGYQKVGLK